MNGNLGVVKQSQCTDDDEAGADDVELLEAGQDTPKTLEPLEPP